MGLGLAVVAHSQTVRDFSFLSHSTRRCVPFWVFPFSSLDTARCVLPIRKWLPPHSQIALSFLLVLSFLQQTRQVDNIVNIGSSSASSWSMIWWECWPSRWFRRCLHVVIISSHKWHPSCIVGICFWFRWFGENLGLGVTLFGAFCVSVFGDFGVTLKWNDWQADWTFLWFLLVSFALTMHSFEVEVEFLTDFHVSKLFSWLLLLLPLWELKSEVGIEV